MQVQLAEKKVYCHISLISVVNTDHPSREKLYYHNYDELGILQPSKYFNAVGRQLTRLIKLVATMPTTSVHLLRREGKEGYINYLVYVIQTTNKQLDNDI